MKFPIIAGCFDSTLPTALSEVALVRSAPAKDQFRSLMHVGCALVQDQPHRASIAVQLTSVDEPTLLDCRAANHFALGVALAKIKVVPIPAPSPVASIVAGTWVIASREWCRPSAGYWQADGMWFLPPGATLHSCEWVDTFIFKPASAPADWTPDEEPIPGTGDAGGGVIIWQPETVPGAPPQVLKKCSALPPEDEEWTLGGIEEFEPGLPDVDTCDSQACMDANPGVWLGSWPIPISGGLFKHGAIATTPPMEIIELMGQTRYTRNTIHSGTTPAYGAFADYKWVKVADASKIQIVRLNSGVASNEYAGNIYTLGSKRFVGTILKTAGISISKEQRKALGSMPGLCLCGNCPDRW